MAKPTDIVKDTLTGHDFVALEDGHPITYEELEWYSKNGQPNRIWAPGDEWQGWVGAAVGTHNMWNINTSGEGGVAWGSFRLGPVTPWTLVNPAFEHGFDEQWAHWSNVVAASTIGLLTGGITTAVVGGIFGSISGQFSGTAATAIKARAAHDAWLAPRKLARLKAEAEAELAAQQKAADARARATWVASTAAGASLQDPRALVTQARQKKAALTLGVGAAILLLVAAAS